MQKFIKKDGREIDVNYYEEDKDNNLVYIKWPFPKNLIMRVVFESFFVSVKKYLVKKDLY